MASTQQEMVRIPHDEALDRMNSLPGWILNDGSIVNEFKFGTFMEAIEFVNKVAQLADQRDHHPDICIYYNKVKIELSTHKVGGLSDKDFELASAIDRLVA